MKTQNAHQSRFSRFLILSVLIHIVLAAALYYAPRLAFFQELHRRLDHTIVDKTEDVVTQIELINEEETRKQVVEQSDNSINETPPKDSKFLSKNDQSVKEETKAALTGKFNNSSRPGSNLAVIPNQPPVEKQKPASSESEKPKTKAQKLGLNGLSLDDTFEKTLQANKPKETQGGLPGQGFSQTDDHLKDIKTGAQTLLNTREFVYYSYFMRVKEQLRSHWSPRIRHNVEFLFAKDTQRSLAALDNKSTSLRVTLNKNGYLEKIELLKTSGYKELDVAAIEAFRAAAPFLNPPAGVVEKDGMIRIVWDFILET